MMDNYLLDSEFLMMYTIILCHTLYQKYSSCVPQAPRKWILILQYDIQFSYR